jgi:hypothetical protein
MCQRGAASVPELRINLSTLTDGPFELLSILFGKGSEQMVQISVLDRFSAKIADDTLFDQINDAPVHTLALA